MYEGEICILGDASLKPYDRVSLMDMYEDVAGDIEVETVIHSMNAETGFTTTFIPDVIVRAEHTSQEFGFQTTIASTLLCLASTLGLKYAIMHAAKKGSLGLFKIGAETIVKKAGESIVAETVKKTALGAFLEGFKDTALSAAGVLITNPVALASTAIA